MPADVLDFEGERLTKTCSEMDDETLVFCMLGLLQIEEHTSTSGECARIAFLEIGKRWIPLDTFAKAFISLQAGEADDGD